MNIRDAINKNPAIGWGVAGALLMVALGLYVFRGTPPEQVLTEKVTIHFTDTDERVEMRRGEIEKQLMGRVGPLDPSQGIVNPKTGATSGVIVSTREWEAMIKTINQYKDAAKTAHKGPTK
jgi:hypothetical protein